jgi:hypothetical protein
MLLHSETAAPMGSNIGSRGVVSKAVVSGNYPTHLETATDYAALAVATRFRLTISTAREVCRMAGIGGAI